MANTNELHKVLTEWAIVINEINVKNGWFEDERPFPTDIALLHSEVSEAFEAFRNGDWTDGKDSVQDELADVFIRLMDTCYRWNVNLARAVARKCERNSNRGYKHGGKLV
jgi:NTP pyrophosphatase (non-canonical NTP hydrolase)